jgi:hypothetical protein
MPRFRDDLTDDDWLRLKEAVREVGQDGPFDANDAVWHVLNTGVSNNAGTWPRSWTT